MKEIKKNKIMNLYIKISYMSYYDEFASKFDYKKKNQKYTLSKYEINISLGYLIQIGCISERAYVYKQVNRYYLIFNVEQVV